MGGVGKMMFGGDSMNVMFPKQLTLWNIVLRFCRVEKTKLLKCSLGEVEHERLNQYSGGPGAEYMSRVDSAFEKLIKKFKYKPKWDEYESSRTMLTSISTAWLEHADEHGHNQWK